jgi:hypothetical protein
LNLGYRSVRGGMLDGGAEEDLAAHT